MTHTDEFGFEDPSDFVSWEEPTREWSPRYVHPRRASAPVGRSSAVRQERLALWLYAACGTAAVIFGMISSRVLLSLFRGSPTAAQQQMLPSEQPAQALPQAAPTAALSSRPVLAAARKVARNHSSAAKPAARGRTRSWEVSTADFAANADEPTRSSDRFAVPDMDLMDIPSSPMELHALAESRARSGDSRSLRNSLIDLQRQRDPMAQLDMMQDPGAALGTLRINSRPWAQVYIDNKPVGTTPVLSMTVPTGRHSVRLVNQEFSMSKTFDIVVGPGERVTRVVSLDD